MKKCPAEIAGNGISRPLNFKKNLGGACSLRRSLLSERTPSKPQATPMET